MTDLERATAAAQAVLEEYPLDVVRRAVVAALRQPSEAVVSEGREKDTDQLEWPDMSGHNAQMIDVIIAQEPR